MDIDVVEVVQGCSQGMGGVQGSDPPLLIFNILLSNFLRFKICKSKPIIFIYIQNIPPPTPKCFCWLRPWNCV